MFTHESSRTASMLIGCPSTLALIASSEVATTCLLLKLMVWILLILVLAAREASVDTNVVLCSKSCLRYIVQQPLRGFALRPLMHLLC